MCGRRLRHFGIDTSHFLGKSANRGPGHRGPRRVAPLEVTCLPQSRSFPSDFALADPTRPCASKAWSPATPAIPHAGLPGPLARTDPLFSAQFIYANGLQSRLSGRRIRRASRLLELLIVVGSIGNSPRRRPSLLRARVSANEAAAIGDRRTVNWGIGADRSAKSGFYPHIPYMATRRAASPVMRRLPRRPSPPRSRASSTIFKQGYTRACSRPRPPPVRPA